jgi:hypothetical protein
MFSVSSVKLLQMYSVSETLSKSSVSSLQVSICSFQPRSFSSLNCQISKQEGETFLVWLTNSKLNISGVQCTQQASKLDFSTDTKHHGWLSMSKSLFTCVRSLSVLYSSFFAFSMNNFQCMQLPKYGQNLTSVHTQSFMYESISSNPPLPFNCICSLSVLWDPLQVANPSIWREKHPQQFSTLTTTNVCSLNAKLQSKQNIIQHTKQSLRVFCSLSTVSVWSILHTPKPWPLRHRSREEETTAARHQHEQLLMYSASENLTGTWLWSRKSLKCGSINL